MIFDYGFSIIGKDHVVKGTCCQDSHCIKKLDNGWYIVAVADGVGSAKNSQIGSRIAVDTVVSVCAEFMPWDYSIIGIKSMLRTAYNYAFKQIIRESEKSGEPIESYDTTLTLVIYDGHKIIYGHSGDGAIIGLNIFGDYIQITTPQKGEDGVSVIPLRAGYTSWKIDSYDEELASILVMTDGMLHILCPYLLRDNQSKRDRVYVPLASFFGDPHIFDEEEENSVKNKVLSFLECRDNFESDYYSIIEKVYKIHLNNESDSIIDGIKEYNYPVQLMNDVDDDKTIVGLINTDIMVDDRESEYYREPDWKELKEAWNRLAYPHLYENKDKENENIHDNNTDIIRNGMEDEGSEKIDCTTLSNDNNDDNSNIEINKIDQDVETVESDGTIENAENEKMRKHSKPKKKGILNKIFG